MRVPQLRLKLWMLLVAAAVPALVLAYYIDAKRREDHRWTLSLFGAIGGREHFRSAETWRDYLEECRRAEEYLGITPRRFAKGAGLWTDEDERLHAEELPRIAREYQDALQEVERASRDEVGPPRPEAVEARDPARDRVDSPAGGPARTGRAANSPDGADPP